MSSGVPVAHAAASVVPRDSTGVYVHLPFCRRKCPYCNFDIAVRRQIPEGAYIDALLRELEARADAFVRPERTLRTIYFGGGTPSLLSPEQLGRVIRAIAGRFDAESPLEITVEANPEDVTDSWIEAIGSLQVEPSGSANTSPYRVTRVSLGVQSFDDATLTFLGRAHSSAEAARACERVADAGLALNVDIIFGARRQRLDGLSADLDRAASLGADHISAYGLTIEPRTPFGRRHQRGETLTRSDDVMADMFELVADELGARGYARYEVSNLARNAHYSQHNTLYWLGGWYLGLGMGAHSMRRVADGGAVRRGSTPDLRAYLERPTDAIAFEEVLLPEVHLAERLFCALRTRFWLDLAPLRAAYRGVGTSWEAYDDVLRELEAGGLVDIEGQRIRATSRGLALHDTIAAAIVDVMPTRQS